MKEYADPTVANLIFHSGEVLPHTSPHASFLVHFADRSFHCLLPHFHVPLGQHPFVATIARPNEQIFRFGSGTPHDDTTGMRPVTNLAA